MSHAAQTPQEIRKLDERELRAWRGLLLAHAALVKALDADLEAEHGLPLSSYEVLMHVADAEDGRMRMHELAQKGLISRSGLTRLVDRLVRDGYLCRETCPSDARGAFAVITPAGREKLAVARATHLTGVRTLFLAHLGEAEQDLLGDVWERIHPGGQDDCPSTCG